VAFRNAFSDLEHYVRSAFLLLNHWALDPIGVVAIEEVEERFVRLQWSCECGV